MKKPFLVLPICLLWASSVTALTLPAVPTEPIYFEPPIVQADQQTQSWSCYQIDSVINQLHPYRYTYKPDYYNDGSNKLATALVVFDSIPIVEGWLGLGYLGYSALVSEKEDRRQLQIEQEIAALQRVKAQKHCYE